MSDTAPAMPEPLRHGRTRTWAIGMGGFLAAVGYIDVVLVGLTAPVDLLGWAVLLAALGMGCRHVALTHPLYLPAGYGLLIAVGGLRLGLGDATVVEFVLIAGGFIGLLDWATPGEWFDRVASGRAVHGALDRTEPAER